ncbi:hypothetical protein ACLOJK_039469 [Asimina triloba]
MSTVLPMKRGRGRPRKYDTPFEREEARRRRRRRTDSTSHGDQVLVGQMVSGVLDGSFDAGYLLTVRVGQTDTVLRGLVFKPGLSVPLSPANDVAPHVKMFARSEVPLPVIQQQNLVPVLAPAPQIQNGWPVMILPINMSALPLDFQAGTVVGIQQEDSNPHPAAGALEDVNHAYQVAARPLQLEIKTENMTSSSAEGQQDAVDLGGLVSRHADQPPMRGKSANASLKEETTTEAVVGKGGPSSPIAAQKLQSGLKNEIPAVIPDAMAHAGGSFSDVTQVPSALPKTEKPVVSLQETKEAINGAATPKRLKEKKRKAPPDGQADGDHQAPLVGGHDKHTLHLGLAHMEDENSHLTMGIREDLQTEKQVQMLVGQSRPVEPSDLQPAVDKGAFDGWASNPAGLSHKDNLA